MARRAGEYEGSSAAAHLKKTDAHKSDRGKADRSIIVGMAKHVIDISELEGAGGFAALPARLRAGEEIVIENGSRPVAVVHPAEPSVRLLSESLRLARPSRSMKASPPM